MSETKVTTPYARLSYPNLFKARMNKLAKREEYSCVLLFKKGEDLSRLKAACHAAMVKVFGEDTNKWPKDYRTPFRDQGDRAKNGALPVGYEEGAIYLNLRTTEKPGVVDQNLNTIIDASEVYAGCWVRASINAYAYDQGANKGVSFGLMNVQFVKDDEPLGTRTTPEMDFQPIGGEVSSGSAPSSVNDLF